MLKKYALLAGFGCLFSPFLQAQQPAQYSLQMLNNYNHNTAYAGLDESVSATLVFRKQWVSFPGSPLTFQANVHAPIPYLRSGLGFGVENDRLGAITQTQIRLSYNYIAAMGKKSRLSVGAGLRVAQFTLNGDLVRTPDGNYESGVIDHQDALLSSGKSTGMGISAEAGVFYQHEKFSLGLAAIHLNRPLVQLNGSGQTQQIRYQRGFSFSGQYMWDISQDFRLQPSVLVKTDLVNTQADLAAILKYKNQFFGGAGYRGLDKNSQDAVIVLLGMQINPNWMLAYSYDISLNALRTFNSGSHEVVLNYNLRKNLGKEIPQKVIYNPRFL